MQLAFSSVALIISILTFSWEYNLHKKQNIKIKVHAYILSFYASTYFIENIPTTEQIINKFTKYSFFSKEKRKNLIKYLLVELSMDKKIEMVTALEKDFDNSSWKSTLNINGKK